MHNFGRADSPFLQLVPWVVSDAGFSVGAATLPIFAALGIVFKFAITPAESFGDSWLRDWFEPFRANLLTACVLPVVLYFLLGWLKHGAFPEYWRRALMVFQDRRSPDFTLAELSRGQRTKFIACTTADWAKATPPREQDSHKAAAMLDRSCVLTIETNEGVISLALQLC